MILDRNLFATDRLAETTTSVKGDTLDAWYSGKARDFGANIQAIMRSLFRRSPVRFWGTRAGVLIRRK